MRGMVLAAGFGRRMQPLSHIRPKALLPCFSFPLLQLVLHRLRPVTSGDIMVNLHHRAEQVEQFLAGESGIIPLPEEKILGTGGGIANAGRQCPPAGQLLLHNVDILSDIDLAAAVAACRDDPAFAILLLHHHPAFLQVHLDDDRITGFGDGGQLAYTGIMVLSEEAQLELAQEPHFSVIEFLQRAISRGAAVSGLQVEPGLWLDCGRADEYLQLHSRFFSDDEYRETVLSILPESPTIRGSCFVGRGLEVTTELEPVDSVIWDNVRIEGGPVRSSVLTDGVVVSHPACQVMVL